MSDPTNAEDAGQESSSQPVSPPQQEAVGQPPSEATLPLSLVQQPLAVPPSQPLPPAGAWPPQPGAPAPTIYPAYPSVGSYPAPPGYAGPPTDPPSGYYPYGYYGQAPWAGSAWQPVPQSKPTNTGKIVAWVLGGILIAVLVLCGGCVGLNVFVLGWLVPPTATGPNAPTATPGSGFSALVPGPGCGTAGWDVPSGQDSSAVQCGASSLLMKQPITATYLTEVDWTSPYANAGYSAWVTTGALSDSTCSGLGFEGDEASYTGYICASGLWRINSYNSSGTSSLLAEGTVSMTSSYKLETMVTASSLVFSINYTQVASVSLTNGGEVAAIVLDLYNYAGEDGSGTFSNFIYTPA